jgi:hypothetical protein
VHRRCSPAKSVRLRFVIVSRSGRAYCCELRLDGEGVFSSFLLRRLPPGMAAALSTDAANLVRDSRERSTVHRCGNRWTQLEALGNDWDPLDDDPVRLH